MKLFVICLGGNTAVWEGIFVMIVPCGTYNTRGVFRGGRTGAPPPTKLSKGLMQILRLKCTKFNFGWGYAQTPQGSLKFGQLTLGKIIKIVAT